MDPRVPSTAFADAWIQVDRTENPGFFVKALDATRAQLLERARGSPADYFRPLEVRPGHRVLDAGCGTGDLLRLIGPLVAPGGAVGLDISETMIEEARRRSGGAFPNVSFRKGDLEDLAFEEASFDRVMATQVLLHLAHPERALRQMARVLAADGLVAITEVDWGTVVVESTDRELGRRFSRLACDELRNGLIVRELPWRLRALGFDRVQVAPRVEVAQDLDAFHEWFVVPSMAHFVKIGAFSAEEVERFLGDLRERAASGRYFSSRTFYSILASRSG